MASGSPDWSPRIVSSGSGDEQKKLAVTAAGESVAFTQTLLSVLIYNAGPNEAHIKRNAAPDTDNFPLPAKAWIGIDLPTAEVHAICAAGKTSTLYLWGIF